MLVNDVIVQLYSRIPVTTLQRNIDETDILIWINHAQKFIQRNASTMFSDYYFKRDDTLGINPGDDSIALPSDFVSVKRVGIYGSGTDRNHASQIDISQLELLDKAPDLYSPDTENPIYWIVGSNLYFRPVSTITDIVVLYYLREAVDVLTVTSKIDVHPLFEDMLIDFCESVALRKFGNVNAGIQIMNNITTSIQNMKTQRAQTEVAETQREDVKSQRLMPQFGGEKSQ